MTPYVVIDEVERKWSCNAGQAEPDEIRDDDDRRAAEEVGVGDRQGPERLAWAPADRG